MKKEEDEEATDLNFWELYENMVNTIKIYIQNHVKWDYFSTREQLYKKKKTVAFCYLILIPFIGIIIADSVFSEMGLSLF